jgi:hypothetical protein
VEYDKIFVVFAGRMLYNSYIGRLRPPGTQPAFCLGGGESGGVNEEQYRRLSVPAAGALTEWMDFSGGKG